MAADAPPSEPLPSAFAALKERPFESSGKATPDGPTTAHGVGWSTPGLQTPSPCLSLRGGPPHSLDASNRSSLSIALSRRASTLPGAAAGGLLTARSASGGAPRLWRTSTALSDRVSSTLGCATVEELCGDSFIPTPRLRKIKALGEGAFAEVEKAQLLPAAAGTAGAGGAGAGNWPASGSDKQIVAVKRLKPHVLESERDCWAFVSEARLLMTVPPHPSIVKYVGLGCQDASILEAQWRTLFLVQEFAAGGTLKKKVFDAMLEPSRKLYSLADAVQWGAQIAEGLAHMHGHSPRVIHRDLKAENVLLRPRSEGGHDACIADFGLHALLPLPGRPQGGASGGIREDGGEGAAEQGGKYRMTGQTGAFVYMAPEVLLGKPYNEKVDVFSFGVILYELLHRRMIVAELMHLGDAEAARNHAFSVAAGYRMPISRDLPEVLQGIVAACWADKPKDRPSMAAVAAQLRALEASGEVEQAEARFGPPPGAACCTIM
ncbi:hypothetical protein ABPG75_010810 [Micractinium tetrahymenae]